MTVTMRNPITNITVIGIDVNFINKWKNLGFEVVDYDSDKVVIMRAS